jgi:hypothetical protein
VGVGGGFAVGIDQRAAQPARVVGVGGRLAAGIGLGAEQVARVVGKTGGAAAILGRRAVAVQIVRKRMRAAEPATRLAIPFPSYLLINLPSKSTRLTPRSSREHAQLIYNT